MLLNLAVFPQFPSWTVNSLFIKMCMIVSWKCTLMLTTIKKMVGLHSTINTFMMWESHKMLLRILIQVLPHLNSSRPWITSPFTTKSHIKATRSLAAMTSFTACGRPLIPFTLPLMAACSSKLPSLGYFRITSKCNE